VFNGGRPPPVKIRKFRIFHRGKSVAACMCNIEIAGQFKHTASASLAAPPTYNIIIILILYFIILY